MFVMVNNESVGGFKELFSKAGEMTYTNGENMDLLSMTKVGFTTIMGYIAMYFMTFPTGQEIVQTYCSAKSGKAAKLGSILAGVVSATYAIVPAIIGLVAYTCIDGYVLGGAQKNALAQATITFAPSILAGIVLAAIVAATMSSASGNMIGTATMFANPPRAISSLRRCGRSRRRSRRSRCCSPRSGRSGRFLRRCPCSARG